MNKRVLNSLVYKYVLEICLAVFLMIVSYTSFSASRLTESGALAKAYSEEIYNVQTSYGRTSEDKYDILAYKDILDQGELTVRNPNSVSKRVDIILSISGNTYDVQRLYAVIGSDEVSLSKYDIKDEKFKIKLKTVEIKPYETYKETFVLHGNPTAGSSFEYSFEFNEVSSL